MLLLNVTNENATILQFLDLRKEVDDISELTGVPLTERFLKHMKANGLDFAALQKIFGNFHTIPKKIKRRNGFVALWLGTTSAVRFFVAGKRVYAVK